MTANTTALQLQSLVTKEGELRVSLASVPVPEPKPDEVVVRVEATPLNPSDLGLLFGAADMNAVRVSGSGAQAVMTAPIPADRMAAMAGQIGRAHV